MQIQTILTMILKIKKTLLDSGYFNFGFACITKKCFMWISFVTHNGSIRSIDLIKAHTDNSVFNTYCRRVDGPNLIRFKMHNRSLIIALDVNTCRHRANTSTVTNRRHDKTDVLENPYARVPPK